ncbi:DUF7518 family protein [Halospeciosus flavus]|uniref:Chromosome segregation protein SMC n=1 Tax=Halospeciosus flavus TaxID=3032283 RepID=A0ABD5Z5D6_9EURY|nr:chromosome segregation protein SMC [Halospeciosus flavus]
MSNESERVEDLEQRVKELEATVRGLTEELVEANERIRQLEGEHDLLEATGVEGRERGGEQSAQAADPEPETEAEQADTDPADEEPKSEDTQEQEEEEESGLGDDIIVA